MAVRAIRKASAWPEIETRSDALMKERSWKLIDMPRYVITFWSWLNVEEKSVVVTDVPVAIVKVVPWREVVPVAVRFDVVRPPKAKKRPVVVTFWTSRPIQRFVELPREYVRSWFGKRLPLILALSVRTSEEILSPRMVFPWVARFPVVVTFPWRLMVKRSFDPDASVARMR